MVDVPQCATALYVTMEASAAPSVNCLQKIRHCRVLHVQARGHVVRQVEFSRPHWPFRGPELTEGSVFPSAFAFRKAELGSVSTGLIYSCVSFFGKQYCWSRRMTSKLPTIRQSGYRAGLGASCV